MKKLLTIIFLMILTLTGCTTRTPASDAQIFKEEYEGLNGTIREKDGKTIRTITIDSENPIVISSGEEVLEKMEKKDSFILYFGFPSCPWCRSVLPTFLKEANEQGIRSIYYVDIETMRDTLVLDEKGNVQVEEKGSEAYYSLLEAMNDVLDSYMLKDESGNEVDTKEKRIYAPNFVIVQKGKAVYKMEGQSSLQTDGYMELSEEMIQDMEAQCEEFFSKALASKDACEVETKC